MRDAELAELGAKHDAYLSAALVLRYIGRRQYPCRSRRACLPVRFVLGPGRQNDMPVLSFVEGAPACDLTRSLPAGQVLADRAYDADSLHDLIYEQGGEPVIPPRRRSTINTATTASPTSSAGASRASSVASRNGRHIATRYDKLADNFLDFVKRTSIMLWLK